MPLNEDLWFLYVSLKLFPVDPNYCLVVLLVVIVALYQGFQNFFLQMAHFERLKNPWSLSTRLLKNI